MSLKVLLIAFAVTATPLLLSASPNIHQRQNIDTSVHCGQFDNAAEGPYTLFLDQFGAGNATSGSQCAQVTSLNGTTISWTTNWTWMGGDGVKSFSNIGLNADIGRQIKFITNLPTTWQWTYEVANTSIANVAYDLVSSTSPDGDAVNEIMVWLAGFNAQPISSEVDAKGEAVPAITNINIEGITWNLFIGSNGATSVFSFLPMNGTIENFSSDLNGFIKFLILNEGLDESQFLITAQAGTEAISGTGTYTVSKYSLTLI